MAKAEYRKAKDRTIGMFDGKTDQEKADEAERIRQGLDNVESAREQSPRIEDNADRWRSAAFQGKEWVSEHFSMEEPGENQYRLSEKDGFIYLEKIGVSDGGPYSYAGVFFPSGDLLRITKVFVAAAREQIKK